ncbi:MAG: AAA family ATPase [Gaiellaceae bacterium]
MRKTVTVVFCDLAGSTEIGERLDAEVLTRVLARYFAEMRVVIEQHGGTVEKYIGDAVMAVFGTPVTHEDDALRAVRAAAKMRERLAALNEELAREWGLRLETRTGVNTGEVLVRDPDPTGALAHGDALNVAARLEQAAAPGEILLGSETHRLVRDLVTAEAMGPIALKGKSESVPVHRLVEVLPRPVRAGHSETPLVGRARELDQVALAYSRAVSDRCAHVFTVLGEAGIGKTRLSTELARNAGGEARVLAGRCLSYGEGITYWPVGEMVRELTLERSLDDILAEHQQRDLVVARVSEAAGLAEGTSGGLETFWAFTQLFETVARERPLVLCFDDLHWAEPSLLDLIEHLLGAIRNAGVLLLCLARPELLEHRPGWGSERSNAVSLRLEPLGAEDSRRLVAAIGTDGHVSAQVQDRIASTSGGNPLFLEQLFAAVEEGDEEVAHAPPAIRALLAARLDRLPAEDRHLLGLASVEGEVFHLGALLELAGHPNAELGARLPELERRELIRLDREELTGEPTYRFRHGLIREVAYEMLPKTERADLHLRLARWFERVAHEQDEILGYHLEQAHRLRTALGPVDESQMQVARAAAERLGAAGLKAYRRADITAAVNLLSRAASLLPPDDPIRLGLAPDLGYALLATGDLPRAGDVLSEALEHATRGGLEAAGRHAQVVYRQLHFFSGAHVIDLEHQISDIEDALEVFEELGDDLGIARASSVIADTLLFAGVAGRPVAAAAERAFVHAHRAGSHQEEIFAIGQVGYEALDGPMTAEEGTAWIEGLVSDLEVAPVCRGYALVFLAVEAAMLDHAERAQDLLGQGRALLSEFAARLSLGVAALMGARVGTLCSDPQMAEREARSAEGYFRAAGDDWTTAIAVCDLARALCDQGRNEEALELLAVLDKAQVTPDPEVLFKLPTTMALALSGLGRLSDAEAYALRATTLFPGAAFLNFRADALLALAELLSPLGRRAEAEAHAREAIALCEQKGNVAWGERARGILSQIQTGNRIRT